MPVVSALIFGALMSYQSLASMRVCVCARGHMCVAGWGLK